MRFALVIWCSLLVLAHAGTLEFKEVFKEVHAPADVKTVTAEFDFTNKTDKEVTISKYESTCSCMAVAVKDGKLRYAPGESGLIRAEFDMGNFSGEDPWALQRHRIDEVPDRRDHKRSAVR